MHDNENEYDFEDYPRNLRKSDHEEIIQSKIKNIKKTKSNLAPIVAPARGKMTTSFWGQAWMKNVSSYEDLEYRIDGGRSYIRRGAVIDMQIKGQSVDALVVGSEVYEVNIKFKKISPLNLRHFQKFLKRHINSTLDLLSGSMPDEMVKAVTDSKKGLFPQLGEVNFNCNCPDYADVCKHIAAILYGIGILFDKDPLFFFQLRGIDNLNLSRLARESIDKKSRETDSADLEKLFDIELI